MCTFFRRACINGTWDKIQRVLASKTCLAKGKSANPTYALIDSQSAKQQQQMKSVDMMEKTKGMKRHIVTDTMGNLLCVHVHASDVHDTKERVYTFEKALYRYPTIIGGRADQGY